VKDARPTVQTYKAVDTINRMIKVTNYPSADIFKLSDCGAFLLRQPIMSIRKARKSVEKF
jgi:hypothetical protein